MYNQSVLEKEELNEQIVKAEKRITNANDLIKGLSEEEQRWSQMFSEQ